MRVRAIKAGHVTKSIPIERDGKQINDAYILPGDLFDWDEPGEWMEPVEEVADPSKREIMGQLDDLGIKYFKGATVEVLKGLLPKG